MTEQVDFEMALSPQFFCEFEIDVAQWKGKFEERLALPALCRILGEEEFAKVFFAWAPEGLYFFVHATSSPWKVAYPNFETGDALELFIDTKNLKSVRTTHRFAHHFVFLPERVEGISAKEITRFRSEDRHELCACNDVEVETKKTREGYEMKIHIPASSLTGYEPDVGSFLGFCYRIHRAGGRPQHFGLALKGPLEFHPYLWSSVKLS
jgi:hypothetical protein